MILPEHLPRFIQRPIKTQMVMQGQAEIRSMDEIEGEILMRTANLCRGNVSEMSRILGIGRTTVWRKLKEYHISVQEYRQKTNGSS
jgi:transcriptional activator for dhaKLM operon